MDKEKQVLFDAAEIAEIVKSAVAEHAPAAVTAAVSEAIKPYVEKAQGLNDYANAIVELERKKAELETPASEKGMKFARYARALALGKGDPDRAAFEAGHAWGTSDPVVKNLRDWRKTSEKALQAGVPSAAGSLIPPDISSEFIDLLRGKSVVRSIARVIPMPFGQLSIRKQTAAATAAYVGESSNATASQQSTGLLNLAFKKLAGLTSISNSLLRFGNPMVDRMVRDDLLNVLALKEDAVFLAGNGLVNTPAGIFTLTNNANVFADAGITYANQISDYTKSVKLVEEADVPVNEENGYWILAPRVFWGIYKTTGAAEDATSPFQAGLNLPEPRLLGYRVKKTTQAKKAYAGGDATESTLANNADRIYFVHADSLIIGDSLNVLVDSFDGAAYHDGSAVVSGVSRDETVIRCLSEHDFGMRYDLAAAVITGVSVGV